MTKIFIAVLPAFVLLSACGGNSEKTSEDILFRGDTVVVSTVSPVLSKLEFKTLDQEPFNNEFRTVGTVQAQNGHFAQVCVPFDGRILSSRAVLGKRVKAGDPLFEFSSPELMDICKQYLQAVKTYEKSRSDYERKMKLVEHGIVSRKEIEEAYAEKENAGHEVESAEASLKVYGIDPVSAGAGSSMNIVAPISGEIVMNNVTPGSYIKSDSDPVITIADLGKVWVTALVKERFIGSVSKGCKAEIFTEADPERGIMGDIQYVGDLVDEQTRSVQVVISCDNADRMLKHGMYVSVHFMSEPKPAVVVPSSAVFQGNDRNYVFVCTDKEDTFVRRYVLTGSDDDNHSRICITEGLESGERIIARGGLYLND